MTGHNILLSGQPYRTTLVTQKRRAIQRAIYQALNEISCVLWKAGHIFISLALSALRCTLQ